MKHQIINYALAITATVLMIISCSKNETVTPQMDNPEVVVTTPDPLLENDSTNLSYDSATVKTAVGVQDEEQNAIKAEKADAEKLNKDKEMMK